MAKSRKKSRPAGPGTKKPKKPRNPFAGRPGSGAGFHSEDRYGKKDRRRGREELEEETGEPEESGK